MSNVISIEELRREFLEKTKPKDVREFVEKQQELLEKFMRENAELKKQVEHATELLKSTGAPLIIGQDNSEELICIEQIKILKERSRTRELDINDVKKLDILIKNLRLIRSQPTDNINASYKDVSEEDLIAIASAQTDK
jgi:esterase/lipase